MEWETYAETESVRQYAEKAFAHVLPYAKGSILDMGCGTGALTEKLAGHGRVVALDPTESLLNVLRAKDLNVTLVHGVVDDLDDAFDLIVASSVCAFIDYPAALKQVARLLKPNGVFIQFDWEDENATIESHKDGLSLAVVREAVSAFDIVALGHAFSHEDMPVIYAIVRLRRT